MLHYDSMHTVKESLAECGIAHTKTPSKITKKTGVHRVNIVVQLGHEQYNGLFFHTRPLTDAGTGDYEGFFQDPDHLPIDAAGTALSDSNILFASILQKVILLLLNMFPVISVSVFESYLILT